MNDTTEPSTTTDAFAGGSSASSSGDPRPLMQRAAREALTAMEDVAPDQLDRPTPCTDMDVNRLLGHMLMALQRSAAAGRDEDPSTWPGEVTGLALAEWAPAWQQAMADAEAAWADPARLEAPVALPWGTFAGRQVVATYTGEITVHTWDLARATGQEPTWDDDVVSASLASIQQMMPAEGRRQILDAARDAAPPDYAWEDPFQAAVDVGDDAAPIDRLVAWTGRTP